MHEVHDLGALGQRQRFDVVDDFVSGHGGNHGVFGVEGKSGVRA
jgi:hypothetical protein